MKVGTSKELRRTCIGCGETRRLIFWSDDTRRFVIARCAHCGVNFHGEGVAVPSIWANSSARGLGIEVDPKAVPP